MTREVPVVILAGGDGSRIGGNKALRLLGGKPLIAHALALAGRWSDHVAIAVRQDTSLPDFPGVMTLHDAEADGGPLSGIVSGLAHARRLGAASVLFIPCDMPFLPDDLPRRLMATLGAAIVAMPQVAGRAIPVCSLWRTAALDHLPDYLKNGRRSPMGLAETVGLTMTEVADAAPYLNINDEQDRLRAEAHYLSGLAASGER